MACPASVSPENVPVTIIKTSAASKAEKRRGQGPIDKAREHELAARAQGDHALLGGHGQVGAERDQGHIEVNEGVVLLIARAAAAQEEDHDSAGPHAQG